MLKTILNFKGVEVLSKDQLLNFVGNGIEVHPACDHFAPPGSSISQYPYYPCATPPLTPSNPGGCTFTIDGEIC